MGMGLVALALEEKCIAQKIKMTGQRRIILRILSESGEHLSVEEILARALHKDKKISITTVYRTVNLLETKGIIDRLDLIDGRARFEGNPQARHHHHLIDIRTHKVIEFTSEALERLKAKIADELGYKIVAERLELYVEKKKKGGLS